MREHRCFLRNNGSSGDALRKIFSDQIPRNVKRWIIIDEAKRNFIQVETCIYAPGATFE